MSIASIVANIRSAVYGKDVRESIASGIETINTEVESTTTKQNLLQQIFDGLIINAGSSNAEVVAGRSSNVTLLTADTIGKRIDWVDASLYDISINVKHFGALGNGVANDTAAIQRAIDYAYNNGYNKVFFPKGIYAVVNLSLKSNIIYEGSGELSIIKTLASAVVWDNAVAANNISNFTVTNLSFDGNKNIVAGNGDAGVINLRITTCSYVKIHNCKFFNNNYSNLNIMNNCNYVWVFNNTFQDSDVGICVMQTPSKNVFIDKNHIEGGTSEGVSIYSINDVGYFNNISITNNIIENKGGCGIKTIACKNMVVHGNIIKGCYTGINNEPKTINSVDYFTYQSTFDSNEISDCVGNGMQIEWVEESKVCGNIIKNSGCYGIAMYRATRTDIKDNYSVDSNAVLNAAEAGNSFRGCIDCDISNNRFSVTRTGVKYAAHAFVTNTTSQVSTNNIFSDNKCIPDTIPVFTEPTSTNVGDIYINNKGSVSTYWNGSTSKRINNALLSRTSLGTQTVNFDWYILDSYGYDSMIVDSADSVKPWVVQGISSNTVFIGKVLKVLFKKTNIQLTNSTNISLKGGASSFIIPVANTVITFIWDGTKWYTSDISAEDNIGTEVPASGKYDIGRKIIQKFPYPGGYEGWICTTAGIACNVLWVMATTYAVGDVRYSGTNVYQCTVAGTSGSFGPTHTTGTAIDGTVTWKYLDKLAAFKGYGLIQSSHVLDTVENIATEGDFTVNMDDSMIKNITPTGDCRISASGGHTGNTCTFVISTSGTTAFNITFGSNFKSAGILNTGILSGKVFTVTFMSTNGWGWTEISRTVAM